MMKKLFLFLLFVFEIHFSFAQNNWIDKKFANYGVKYEINSLNPSVTSKIAGSTKGHLSTTSSRVGGHVSLSFLWKHLYINVDPGLSYGVDKLINANYALISGRGAETNELSDLQSVHFEPLEVAAGYWINKKVGVYLGGHYSFSSASVSESYLQNALSNDSLIEFNGVELSSHLFGPSLHGFLALNKVLIQYSVYYSVPSGTRQRLLARIGNPDFGFLILSNFRTLSDDIGMGLTTKGTFFDFNAGVYYNFLK